MAIKYLNNIDLRTNELQYAVIQSSASDPIELTPKLGQIYFNNIFDKLTIYTSTGWLTIGTDNGYIPYTGANASVNLGVHNLTATKLIKSGGSPTQFLMADGSVTIGNGGVYSYEIHVSQVDGNDTTGTGAVLNPVATITHAMGLVTAQRRKVIVHSGGYGTIGSPENIVIPQSYVTITTGEQKGDDVVITGTISTSFGCTISGLKMTNLNINAVAAGAGSVNILGCDITGTLTKSGYGDYTLIRFCDIGRTNITGSGLVAIFGGNPRFVTVNNAAASIIVKNAVAVSPALIAGNANFVDCIIPAIATQWISGTTYAASTAAAPVLVYNLGFTYSRIVAGAGSTAPASDPTNWLLQSALNGIDTRNGITTAIGTIITIANSQIIVPTFQNVARVSLGGIYSILNCVYDRPNSTLSAYATSGGFQVSGSTNSIVYSQFMNADKFIKQGGTSDQILLADGSTSSLSEKISKITIQQIRLLTGTLPNNNLYTTDLGQEGNWYYDSTDTTSVDNTGTILVTADGKRIKRITDFVTPEMFGAKGDGITDDKIAIQKAVLIGKPVYFKNNTTYKTTSVINIGSNTKLIGYNSTIKNAVVSSYGVIEVPETTLASYGVETFLVKGLKTFSYSQAYAIQVGDIVYLKGIAYAASGTQTYENGWYGVVESVNGSVVTLKNSCPSTITSPSIYIYKYYNNISISGLNIDMTGATNGFGLNLLNVTNSNINNVLLFSDGLSTSAIVGINAQGSDVLITKCQANNFRFVFDGAGYGINVAGHNMQVDLCTCVGSKHGITSAGRTWASTNIIFSNNIVSNTIASGIDIHGAVSNSIINNNIVYSNSRNGFALRSPNVSFYSNTNYVLCDSTINASPASVTMDEFGGSNTTISDFRVYTTLKPGSLAVTPNAIIIPVTQASTVIGVPSITKDVANLIIQDSYLEGQIKSELGSIAYSSISILNNQIIGTLDVRAVINLSNFKTCEIKSNNFVNPFPNATFNFSINVGDPTLETLINYSLCEISNNSFRITDAGNNNSQIRISRIGVTVRNNIFYTNSSLINFCSTSSSVYDYLLEDNLKISSLGVASLSTFTSLPTASIFYVGKKISTIISNLTTDYICRQNSVGVYEFYKITNPDSLIIGGTSLNALAILQADSTTKGFLPPRMTTSQKNAITTPSGLVVYDITLNKLCVRGASNWETITST